MKKLFLSLGCLMGSLLTVHPVHAAEMSSKIGIQFKNSVGNQGNIGSHADKIADGIGGSSGGAGKMLQMLPQTGEQFAVLFGGIGFLLLAIVFVFWCRKVKKKGLHHEV